MTRKLEVEAFTEHTQRRMKADERKEIEAVEHHEGLEHIHIYKESHLRISRVPDRPAPDLALRAAWLAVPHCWLASSIRELRR